MCRLKRKTEISEPSISEPAVLILAPDPVTMEKGESQLAGERENIESKIKATVRLIEAQGEELFPSMRKLRRKIFLVGADLYLENYIVCTNLEGWKYTEESGKFQTSELFNPLSLDRNLDLNCSVAHSL